MTRLARRLAALEAQIGDTENACGPHVILTFTRHWRADGSAATDASVAEDKERIARAIERVQVEAREHACDEPQWILSVRVADDGGVEVAGCPWWAETPREPARRAFAACREGVWRRYA
jgi:hypothetical protein